MRCDVNTVQTLLKEEADVDKQDVDGNTALHLAVIHSNDKASLSK